MITHRYSWKNDGRMQTSTAMDRAITEAFVKYHETHGTEFVEVIVKNLACDDPSHYPDLCHHYEVTITAPTHKEPGPYVHCPDCNHWLVPTHKTEGQTFCVWHQGWVTL